MFIHIQWNVLSILNKNLFYKHLIDCTLSADRARNRVESRCRCCIHSRYFSCYLCNNTLFWPVLFFSFVVLSCLDFPFVYVLLKICLIVLYINDLLWHCVILTCVIQTVHQANTWNFNFSVAINKCLLGRDINETSLIQLNFFSRCLRTLRTLWTQVQVVIWLK